MIVFLDSNIIGLLCDVNGLREAANWHEIEL
jgi:hypothetical protein